MIYVKSPIFLVAVTLLFLSKDPAVASQDCTVSEHGTCFASVSGQPPPEMTCCASTPTAGAEYKTCHYEAATLSSAIAALGTQAPAAFGALMDMLPNVLVSQLPCPTDGLQVPHLPTAAYPAIVPFAATITSCLIYPTCTCG
ncbi:MAG: hypothetical protein JOS17DRAFT_729109 [Linnemannia elongata]|nr:MAG: hypothetical protein JOS17DRAFT_729109 [Linnemannia elongata]